MNSLTEEQRRRIDLNRQRALERGKRRKHNFGDESQTGNFDYGHAFHTVGTAAVVSNNRPDRESFDDGGIDWEAVAGEADRLMARTSRRATSAQPADNFNYSTDATAVHGAPNDQWSSSEGKRQRMENERAKKGVSRANSQRSGLTEEQQARMEENRRKALERKQQKPPPPLSPLNSALPKSSVHLPFQGIYNDEQRARMEENRRKALAKKQLQQASQLTTSSVLPTTTAARNPVGPAAYNEEQRARMEENRRRALKKKQRASSRPAASLGPQKAAVVVQVVASQAAVYNDDQRARMEENRRRALEKKQQKFSQASSQRGPIGGKGATGPASSGVGVLTTTTYSNEQRARMEENRRRALDKKRQRDVSPPVRRQGSPVPSAPASALPKGRPPPQITDEHRARMEENRRRALERKMQHVSPVRQRVSPVPAPPAPAPPKNATQRQHPAGFDDERRARAGGSSRKAPEAKERVSRTSSPPRNVAECPPPTIADERRARTEEEKRRAFEKEIEHLLSPIPARPSPALPKSAGQCPFPAGLDDDRAARTRGDRPKASEEEGPANQVAAMASLPSRVEEDKRAALEKDIFHLSPIAAQSLPETATQCPLPTSVHDGHQERMEGNPPEASEEKGSTPHIAAKASPSPPPNGLRREERELGRDASAEEGGQKATKEEEHRSQVAPPSDTQCPPPRDVIDSPPRPSPKIAVGSSPRPSLKLAIKSPWRSSSASATRSPSHPSPKVATEIPPHPSPATEGRERADSGKEQSKCQSKLAPTHDTQDSLKLMQGVLNTCPCRTSPGNSKVASMAEGQRASADSELEEQKMHFPVPSDDACDTDSNPPAKEPEAASRSISSELDKEKATAAPSSPTKTASPKKSALPTIPKDIEYERMRVLPIIDDDTDSLIENAQVDQPLLNGWPLYDHQKEGVLRALRMRRLILAFDMGLGKTVMGLVWAKSFLNTFKGIKIFLIAPVSLHDDWKKMAAEAVGLTATDGKENKKSKAKKPKTKKAGNTKKVGKTATGKRKKKAKEIEPDSEDEEECKPSNNFDMYVLSWQGVSKCESIISDMGVSDYVVICDEAHSLQSMKTNQTQETLKLVSSRKCRGVLLLSGTPMKNGKPSNLFPLLKAVKHPFGDQQKLFEFFFCNGQQKTIRGRVTWDANGSSNLKELNAHTASHIFRMTKEECMAELPPRKREFIQIPVASLHELRYTQALKDLAAAFSSSKTYPDIGKEDLLSPLQKLRQMSSIAKVRGTVQLCNSIIKEESSLVIFTAFVAVAKEVREKLSDMDWAVELLTGETPPKKRQEMVDNFQSGLSPVFVCTYGAGGVGLTLTAACTVVLVDRPWTPGDVCQAEDRVRRIGQKRPVRSIWIKAFPIDEQIDKLIDHKEENSSTAVDGKGHDGKSKSAPKVSIAELVKSLLTSDSRG